MKEPTWPLVSLKECANPRKERAHPNTFPNATFVGLEHLEAQTTKLVGRAEAKDLKSLAGCFRVGDTLYGRLRPYLNKVWTAKFGGLCSGEFIVLVPAESVAPGFLTYRMNAPDFVAFTAKLDSGDRPRVSWNQISSFQLNLPTSRLQQTRIVEHLDLQFSRLEAGVAALKRAQENLKRCRASILKAACEGRLLPNEADLARQEGRDFRMGAPFPDSTQPGKLGVLRRSPRSVRSAGLIHETISLPEGWVATSLGSISEIQLGIMLDKARRTEGSPHPYLRNINVRWGRFDLSSVQWVPIKVDQLDRFLLREGDLIVCEGGEPGRSAVWRGSVTPMAYQKALHRIRPRAGVSASFLQFAIQNAASTGHLATHFTGTTIKHLTKEAIRELEILLPPLAEQDRIVAEVERRFSILDQMESAITASLSRATRLRQAILAKAFSIPTEEG